MKSLASNSSTSSTNSLGRSGGGGGGGGGTSAQLSHTEVTAVRQLIAGYRESAAFLLRSADELENLILQQNWPAHSLPLFSSPLSVSLSVCLYLYLSLHHLRSLFASLTLFAPSSSYSEAYTLEDIRKDEALIGMLLRSVCLQREKGKGAGEDGGMHWRRKHCFCGWLASLVNHTPLHLHALKAIY